VPSLTVPDARHIPPIEMLNQFESVRLFVERAELIQPNFALTTANASPIAQICRRLDGIPLAIELAVARVKVMHVEQVAARLDDRFRLLTGGSRNALPRHQTLGALIDWSYDLLSDIERTLLRRLSVFAGGWTLEAAEAICAGEGIEPYHVLDLLTQLVNKSLVIPELESGSETRYRLLETIRQYAREKLFEAGGGDKVRERHLDYYLKFAEYAEPELRGPNQIAWLNRLEKEVDNLRAALEWAVEDNVEAGLRMAGALLWFWHIRSHKSEGIEWLERALSAEAEERGTASLSSSRADLRGKALNAAGALLLMHGNQERGEELANESLALHQGLGPTGRVGEAFAFYNLAQGASYRQDLAQARALSEQGLSLFREAGDKFGMAQCLDNLGSYALLRGDYVESKTIWEEDLALRKELGDKDGIAWNLSCLADLAFWQGDYERATSLYTESQEVFREVGNQWAVSMALSGLGGVMQAQGKFEQAAKLYEEALAFGRDMGDQNAIAGRRYDLARVAWSRGDYEQAARLYDETLTYVRAVNHKSATAGTLIDLGGVAWAQGNLELAVKRCEESLAIGRELQAKYTIANALTVLGIVACARGEYGLSLSLLREALTTFRDIGNRWSIAFSLEGFIMLAMAQREWERAARLFGATESLYTQFRFLWSPLERDIYEQNLVAARSALGETAFARLMEEGRAMTLDRAIAYTLEV
jgi:tetratricopeptide (TPR) repeat protein